MQPRPRLADGVRPIYMLDVPAVAYAPARVQHASAQCTKHAGQFQLHTARFSKSAVHYQICASTLSD
eukprot:scaffold52835_cov19-Tisochrysis_lutea.AAC.1